MRVVIAEDDALLREGLALLLRHAGCVVPAATGDGEAFLDAVRAHRPDVTVVDVRLPPSYRDEGLRAALRARQEFPGLPVLVLSQYVARDYAAELLSSGGAVGYLLKDRVSRVEEFVAALRRVAAGGTALDPDVVAQLLVRGLRDPLSGLTPREREVLALMAEGHDNQEIAVRLRITGNAVHKHISNIFAKLQLGPDVGGHRRVRAVLAYLR
ncbi:response regulator [Catenuloplanes japonicus]|uniref:response regulator n=1 Tax=Catenuloplanes japonicus TaxID=33876 RepID=UPI0005258817|nr:response regulator transcription factor [Catenuloplanes japonicus]